jgi:hypothetical protein
VDVLTGISSFGSGTLEWCRSSRVLNDQCGDKYRKAKGREWFHIDINS